MTEAGGVVEIRVPLTASVLYSHAMPLHLIKLAVGCDSVKELKGWVAERMKTARKKGLPQHHIHITRMTPKRVDDILGSGSLYWVIRGEIAADHPIK